MAQAAVHEILGSAADAFLKEWTREKVLAVAGLLHKNIKEVPAVVPQSHDGHQHLDKVNYCRGKHFIEFLTDPKQHKSKAGLASITTKEQAEALCTLLLHTPIKEGQPAPLLVRAEPLRDDKTGKVRTVGSSKASMQYMLRLLRPGVGGTPKDLKFEAVEGVSSGSGAGSGAGGAAATAAAAEGGKGEKSVRYVWLWEGPPGSKHLMLIGIVTLVLLVVMGPLWPALARQAVGVIASTLLAVLLGLIVLQGIVFALFWVFGMEFWIFPNLTSETAGITELFTPVYTFEWSKGGKASTVISRVAVASAFAASIYWLFSMPTDDWDAFMESNRKLMEDIVSGNLLAAATGIGAAAGSGVATSSFSGGGGFFGRHGPGSRFAGRPANVPSFDELDHMLQEQEAAAAAEKADKAAAAAAAAGESGSDTAENVDLDAEGQGASEGEGAAAQGQATEEGAEL